MEMLAKQQVAVVLVLPMMRLKMSRRKKMPRRNRNGIPMWQWKGKKATGVDGWIGVASCWPDWTAVKGTKWKNSRNSNWEAINNIFCFFWSVRYFFFCDKPINSTQVQCPPCNGKTAGDNQWWAGQEPWHWLEKNLSWCKMMEMKLKKVIHSTWKVLRVNWNCFRNGSKKSIMVGEQQKPMP